MLLTVEYEGRKTINVTADEALTLGYPKAVVDAAKAAGHATLISGECRRRIYALASAETQMNMAAASAVISAKTASTRTDQEKAVLAGLEAAIGWVGAMRANVATLAGDPSKDFTDDENWPDVPAAAAAIADQF